MSNTTTLIQQLKEATIGTALEFYADPETGDVAVAFPNQPPFIAFYEGGTLHAPLDENGQAINDEYYQSTSNDNAGNILALVIMKMSNQLAN